MAVGTGVVSPPVQMLSTASAVLAKIPLDLVADNIMLPSPLLWAMTRRGVMGGQGAAINYTAMFLVNTNQGAYFGDQLLNNNVVDTEQPIELQWKFNYQAVTIPITDLILQYGSGMTGVRDLLTLRLMGASASFTQYLSQALWGTAPANTALDVDNLDAWVGQVANTIGGVNRALAGNAWWRPPANLPTMTGNSLQPAEAERAYQTLGFGYDYPDCMVMQPNPYATFKMQFTQNIRYLDGEESIAPDGSFRNHFLFNNAVVLVDRFTIANSAYMFNTKYIYPKFHEADYFTIDPWLKPSRQRILTTSIYLAWNIITLAPRSAGIRVTGVGV